MNGKSPLQSGKSMLYSGKKDGLHQEVVGIMLSNRTKMSLMQWNPKDERLMHARFFTTSKISVVITYSPKIKVRGDKSVL
jgi:hypothetical protein